ncbi:MAG: hypothetical protein IT208_14060 [Chthonomonadales bacterium]|nr:hypothetical protein [Chthonomonadales bacterium]
MKVSAPGHGDVVALASVYWMQRERVRVEGKERQVLTAWFDPARMAAPGGEEPSTIRFDCLVFTGATLEPSIAEPGQSVTLTAALPSPPEPAAPVVVLARLPDGKVLELVPVGSGLYRARFTVDRRYPRNDSAVTVLAYARRNSEEGRVRKAEGAVKSAGFWDARKPYV